MKIPDAELKSRSENKRTQACFHYRLIIYRMRERFLDVSIVICSDRDMIMVLIMIYLFRNLLWRIGKPLHYRSVPVSSERIPE